MTNNYSGGQYAGDGDGHGPRAAHDGGLLRLENFNGDGESMRYF